MGLVQEAILIKFGNIIAGLVLWSYYGFLNLVNLSSPSPNSLPHLLLPSTTTGCGLRTISGYFLSFCPGFLLFPHMGSQRQDGVEKEGKTRQSGILSGLVTSSALAWCLVL